MSRATTWRLADFPLVAFDMDSTPRIECTDEVADAAGRKAEVAAITEAAMRGEITDYKDMRPTPPGDTNAADRYRSDIMLHRKLT